MFKVNVESIWGRSAETYYRARYQFIKFLYLRKRQVLSILYLAALSYASFFIYEQVNPSSLDKNYSDLFVTLGVMLAGMLAIVFAIRTVAIQHAASAQSALLYEIVARDNRTHFTYWYLTFLALIHITFGLFLKGHLQSIDFIQTNIVISLEVTTLGISFLLISDQFVRLYDRVSPLRSLRLIKLDFFRRVEKISKRIDRLSKDLEKEPRVENIDSRLRAKAEARITLHQRIGLLFQDLDFLFDYHDKLKTNSENTASRMVLITIGEITNKYIDLIKESSFLVQSSDPWYPVSDSQEIFNRVLERLTARGKIYVEEQNDEGARNVLTIMEGLAIRATKITFLGDKVDDNPIVHQIRFHVGLMIEFAITNNHVEILFQSAGTLTRIGDAAAKANLYLEAGSISQLFTKIANSSLMLYNETIWHKVAECHGEVLSSFGNHCNKNIDFALSNIYMNMQLYFPLLFGMSQSEFVLSKITGQDKLADTCRRTSRMIQMELTELVKSNSDRRMRLGRIKSIMKEYEKFLHSISQSIKNADSHFTEEIANSFYGPANAFISLANDERFKDLRKVFEEYVKSLLRILRQFAEDAITIKNEDTYDTLVDMATKIGIVSIERRNEIIAVKAIKTIERLAAIYINKTNEKYYDLTPVRIMQKACFIGIVALKSGMKEVVEHLKGVIITFNTKAHEQASEDVKESKEGKLTLSLIESEVGNLHDDCAEEKHDLYSLDKSSRRKLYSLIDCPDIDNFCLEMWDFKASERYRTFRF